MPQETSADTWSLADRKSSFESLFR